MEMQQQELTSKEKHILKYCKEVMKTAYELYLLNGGQKKPSHILKKKQGGDKQNDRLYNI